MERRLAKERATDGPPWLFGLVFALALLVRLVVLYQTRRSSPFFDFPVIDAMRYDHLARGIAALGQWPESGPFYQPPGYPLFLAACYKLLGDSYLVPRLIQAVIGSLSCLLVSLIGSQLKSRWTGFWAGTICAVYGPLIFFDLELLPTAVTIFWSLIGFWLLLRGLERRSLQWFMAAGLGTGLATICWPLVGLFGAAAGLYLLAQHRREAAFGLTATFLLWLGMTLPIAPVTIHNINQGSKELISSNGGITLYASNNPDWHDSVLFRPGYSWEKMITLPYRLYGVEEARRRGTSAIFVHQVGRYIAEQPGRFLAAEFEKLSHLLFGYEIMNPIDPYFRKQYSPLLDLLILDLPWLRLPFGLLLPLAAAGLAVQASRPQRSGLLATYIGAGAAGMLLFCVSARFRLIIVPFLAIVAASGLTGFTTVRRARAKGPFMAMTATLLAFALLANTELFGQRQLFLRPVCQAQAPFSVGRVLFRQGRYTDAIPWLTKAIQIDPGYPDAWVDLGRSRYELGDIPGAITAMRKAQQAAPDYPLPLFNLARIHDLQGQPDPARLYYLEFLHTAETYYELQVNGPSRINLALQRLAALTPGTTHLSSPSPSAIP